MSRKTDDLADKIVTREELLELADLESKYAAAKQSIADVEKLLDAARKGLAEKVLGEASTDLSTMSPEQVAKLMAERLRRGSWRLARNAPRFAFLKTWAGRCPAWKQLFIQVRGEAQADRIGAATPTSYSYRVDVAA